MLLQLVYLLMSLNISSQITVLTPFNSGFIWRVEIVLTIFINMVGKVKLVNGKCQASKELCGGVSAKEDLVEGKGNKMADVIVDENLQLNLLSYFADILNDNSIHLGN